MNKAVIDYLDLDVSYLLGLITARGELSESGEVKRIIIEFPFRKFESRGNQKENSSKRRDSSELAQDYF